MSRQTFDIFDGAGNGLATVTLYNMGVNLANQEAVKLAKSLSDDWAVARADKCPTPNAYEPNVSPRDCAIGGEEDSNWT